MKYEYEKRIMEWITKTTGKYSIFETLEKYDLGKVSKSLYGN